MCIRDRYIVFVPAPPMDPNDQSTWPPQDVWPDPNDPNSLFDPNNPFTPPDVPESRSTGLGAGGGLVCWSSDALIENCFISENTTLGSGGGVYFGGDPYTPTLKNCLVKANTATVDGGGIASHWFAAPTIENCTIVENFAYDPNFFSTRGKGGGLVASHSSNTELINSILWNNCLLYTSDAADDLLCVDLGGRRIIKKKNKKKKKKTAPQ